MSKFSFSDSSYSHGFKKAIGEISMEVSPPNYMAVLSDYYLTRKPYWTWLKRACDDSLKNDPESILDFFGLKNVPAPDVFAWYCCIFHSYCFLMGSSSCHYSENLTQWGEYLQNFLKDLLTYGVEERFICKQSASDLLISLLCPELSKNISLVDKHVPSSYANRISSTKRGTGIGCCILAILLFVFLFIIFISN